MLFVPLPLFATLLLSLAAVRLAMTRDMSNRAHQLFVGLIALYAVQSLLLTLRWGYDVQAAAAFAAVLAPALPALAYLSYTALTAPLRGIRLWPLLLVPLIWLVWLTKPQAADALIFVTYLGFGGLLIRLAWRGPNQLALSPLEHTQGIMVAMVLTGAALVASALTDIYVVVDFIRNEGRNVGLIVTFVQTIFVLVIGISAAFGRASRDTEEGLDATPPSSLVATAEDSEIVARLDLLFETDRLHANEDLSLRRIARRLQLPDRRVSNAINRIRGISVSQFVNEYRIKDACNLLATTDDSILAISLIAGFATKSNFNREFLRVIGTAPSKWRKEKAND